ncbi:hypothetical protein CHU98_g9038 [Xylaria longipes]|nr:hypothetical protein CHU98_g9038 [Xylaria longipes]
MRRPGRRRWPSSTDDDELEAAVLRASSTTRSCEFNDASQRDCDPHRTYRAQRYSLRESSQSVGTLPTLLHFSAGPGTSVHTVFVPILRGPDAWPSTVPITSSPPNPFFFFFVFFFFSAAPVDLLLPVPGAEDKTSAMRPAASGSAILVAFPVWKHRVAAVEVVEARLGHNGA